MVLFPGKTKLSRLCALLFCLATSAAPAHSDDVSRANLNNPDTPRFILHLDQSEEPVGYSQMPLEEIGKRSHHILEEARSDFEKIIHAGPISEVTVRFLSPNRFKQEVAAPEWATGVFFRREILIPLSENAIREQTLLRTLRHEYVHAVLADYNCPAWLNEGLAQVFEGRPDAGIRDKLVDAAQKGQLTPLQDLQNSFMNLNTSVAALAYEESFFAVMTLIDRYGTEALGTYLTLLKHGSDAAAAFNGVYGMSVDLYYSSELLS